MSTRRRYLLDANVLMEAKRRYYRFDLCPGFWDCVVWQHKQGVISSIDKVKDEIEQGKDDLSHWVKRTCPSSFFVVTTDPNVAGWYGKIVVWVQSRPQYLPEAKSEFAAGADGWLIAYAKQNSFFLVTHEVPSPESRTEVKIPNVCKAFDVPYIDTFDMLENLKTKFTWKPAA